MRTRHLERATRFYVEALGLKEGHRPPFGFPGAWLYGGDEADIGVVHLIGADGGGDMARYLGERTDPQGAGVLDHVAFAASDWPSVRASCERSGVPYVCRTVPELGLLQVFLTDPSGIVVELNFPAVEANGEAP